MDDFTLSLCGGFPAQEVIVGGDYSLGGDLSPDISHFFGHEEIIFEERDYDQDILPLFQNQIVVKCQSVQ